MSIDKKNAKETPWTAEAYVSNANHQSKRFTFLLFINRMCYNQHVGEGSNLIPRNFCALDRLVESSRMKRAIEAGYTGILAKGSSPFVYLRSAYYF